MDRTWKEGGYYVAEAAASSITYTNNSRVLTEEKNLLLSTEDDYGTSFYYRGAVDNNYLVFANMCWRIVRIDGLGNIKLVLYNYNPNNVSNPCASSQDGLTYAFARVSNSYQSKFNTSNDKNTYIGFMYSNNPDSSNFDVAHANDNDSTILTFLKNWYDQRLRGVNDMLADVIWCNDKSLSSGDGVDNTANSQYGATYRLMPISSAAPSLVCPNAGSDGKLSKFTARDAINGNAKLYSNNKEYKIGLLTADEIAFAGAANGDGNSFYYLYKNASDSLDMYWSLSPHGLMMITNLLNHSKYASASVWGVENGGTFVMKSVTNPSAAVRPAVSLKSDVTISEGNGTSENPFRVIEPEGIVDPLIPEVH